MTATSTLERKQIEPRPQFAKILRTEESFATRDGGGYAHGINEWFDRLMRQSAIEAAPGLVLRLCLLGAIACGGSVFVVAENLLTTAVAAEVGALLPIGVLLAIRARRQSRMLRELPAAIEGLADAARNGDSLIQALEKSIADAGLLGNELALAARRLELGLGVNEALADLPERTGLAGLCPFVGALSIWQRTGGDMVAVLDRLARTTRERLAISERLQAAAIARKATGCMLLVPAAIAIGLFAAGGPIGFEQTVVPKGDLQVAMTGLALQLAGSYAVLRLLKNSQRT